MPRGRPLAPLTLTDEQQDQLNGIARSATLPYALVQRARMILASAEGLNNSAVAQRLGVTPQTVGKWRRRFREAGIEGLHDEIRPGRPRTYDDDKVASVINRALQETPDASTHWSTRTLGQAEGLSKSTVQRWLALFGVKPHLAQTFKLSGHETSLRHVGPSGTGWPFGRRTGARGALRRPLFHLCGLDPGSQVDFESSATPGPPSFRPASSAADVLLSAA